MQDKSIVVAVLDFGSSTIKLALAEKIIRGEGENAVTLEDYIRVIYYDEEPSEGAIVRGVIRNLNDTANKVRRLILRAQEEVDITIRSVYVLVDGQGLQSKMYSATLEFDQPQEIKNSDLGEILKLVSPEPNKYNFDNPYARFYVGGTYAERPVGVKGLSLRGEFQFFQTEQYVIDNIYDVLENKLDLEVISFWVAPALLGEKFLTNEQMRIGSAVIDFGAESTSIAIYKNGFLEGLRVLPIGSQQITDDLTHLQISPVEAERLKRVHGKVLLDLKENDSIKVISADMHTEKTVIRYRVNQYIEARMREIVDNLKRMVVQFLGDEKLHGGIIISGGGALVGGLVNYLKEHFETSVEHASFFVSNDAQNSDFLSHVGIHPMYALLIKGAVACTEVSGDAEEEMVSTPAQPSEEYSGVETKIPRQGSLFDEDELPETSLDLNDYEDDEIEDDEEKEVPRPQPRYEESRTTIKERRPKNRKKGSSFLDKLKGILPFDWDEMESDDETI